MLDCALYAQKWVGGGGTYKISFFEYCFKKCKLSVAENMLRPQIFYVFPYLTKPMVQAVHEPYSTKNHFKLQFSKTMIQLEVEKCSRDPSARFRTTVGIPSNILMSFFPTSLLNKEITEVLDNNILNKFWYVLF